MTRKHRLAHRLIWPALAVAVCAAFLTALVLRPPPAVETPAATQESRP